MTILTPHLQATYQQGSVRLGIITGMSPRNRSFPFVLFAAGVVAATVFARRAQSENKLPAPSRREVAPEPRRFVLEQDVPSLGFRQGDLLRVEPHALIYIGDIVSLYSNGPEVVLARYHDELMHCVEGLVVRERETTRTYY